MEADVCSFQHLPNELLYLIFLHLDSRSLLRAAEVCCQWALVAHDETFWRKRYYADFVMPHERASIMENLSLDTSRGLTWRLFHRRREKFLTQFATGSLPDAILCVGHKGDINCIALDEQNSILVSGSNDMSIRIWHLPARSNIKQTTVLHEERAVIQPEIGFVLTVSIDVNRNMILAGGFGSQVAVISNFQGKLLAELELPQSTNIWSSCLTPTRAIVAGQSSQVGVYDLASATPLVIFMANPEQKFIRSFSVWQENIIYLACGRDIRLFDLRIGVEDPAMIVGAARRNPNLALQVALSGSGTRLLSSGIALHEWDVAMLSRDPIRSSQDSVEVSHMSWDGWSRHLGATHSRQVWLWDMPSHQPDTFVRLGTRFGDAAPKLLCVSQSMLATGGKYDNKLVVRHIISR